VIFQQESPLVFRFFLRAPRDSANELLWWIPLRMLVAMSIGCLSTILAFILEGHILLAPSGLFSIPPRVTFCSIIWLEGKQN
jgi:hypothetical protein